MNILIVSQYGLYNHFSASFVHAQAKAYAALGHRVRVIVPIAIGKRDWDGRRFSGPWLRREKDGIELYLLRHLSLSNYGRKRINTETALWAVQRSLDKILEGFCPDIIHAQALGVASAIGGAIKNRLGIPLVVTAHGETVCDDVLRDPSRIKQLADQADLLIAVSSMLQRQLLGAHVDTETRVILNGFHVQETIPNQPKRPLSLIQAGFLVARKKADVTIRAFAKLQAAHPNATLDLIGSGEEQKGFQALCRDLHIENSVCFHGYLPNPETLMEMSKARFFVMPSIQEGFGIVYLEAMAAGCVTIGTEKEGIADLIVSGENGFLVPPDDPDAIVRVIEWCLEHPEEADVIAEKGRQDAQSLTWERNAKQYISLFQELIGS